MITIYSFSRRESWSRPRVLPDDVYDCTLLRNPFGQPTLKERNGTDAQVKAYVKEGPSYEAFMKPIFRKLSDSNTQTFAFMCLGGRHRSVVCAEDLAKECVKRGIPHKVEHRILGIKWSIV